VYRAPPTIKAHWNGYLVRAVGNRIYLRPPTETFTAFVIGHLRWQLGEPWLRAEEAKRVTEQHCLVAWFRDWQAIPPPSGTVPGEVFRFRPSGAVRDLGGLADDVYRLMQIGCFPKRLKARLKQRDQFQGVRYEIAIAGAFARLGFAIDWNEKKGAAKQCEFAARHPNGEVIAVEAKSRHRPGALHVPDETSAPPSRADVEALYRQALEQNPKDKPFAIFLDINLPPQPGRVGFEKTWIEDVKMMLNRVLPEPSPLNPDPHTLLCITNMGGHWERDAIASPSEVVVILSKHARFPLKDVSLFERLRRVLGGHSLVDDPA
jgi:hypothetical protein